MNKKIKLISLLAGVLILLNLASCSDIKITADMQSGIDAYIEAIKKSQTKTSGSITVTSTAVDNAIEFKSTESVIKCQYSIADNKVSYTRSDFLDGKRNAQYRCDGQKVESYDFESEQWQDKTEQNNAFLSPETNPLTTLSLFRVDSNYKVRTDFMTDIKYNTEPDENWYTSVEFTLKDSTVSDVLGYNKVKGIVRKSAGHTRTYFIDSNGYIAKVIVSTNQLIYNNGKEGSYATEMTVVCQ